MHDFILLLKELGYNILNTSTFSLYKENTEVQNRFIIQFSSDSYDYSLHRFLDDSYALYLNENRLDIDIGKHFNFLVYESDTIENMVDFLKNGFNQKNKVKA